MLNGLAPVIVFTFFKELPIPAFLQGFITATKIPLIPIPIYLDEKFTKVSLDDYERDLSIDVVRDGTKTYERTSTDAVSLKFRADKSNIFMTAITALIDQIVENVEQKNYSISIFYDNIFILNASLESFSSRLVDNSTMREISIKISNRPKEKSIIASPIQNIVGTAKG